MITKTAYNNNQKLEYLSNGISTEKIPLIMSMGIWEPAFRAEPVLRKITDRKALALSYRGRGGSEAPEKGYDWTDHATDLDAVITAEKIDHVVFLGFSKGVPYMLGYLRTNPAKAKGLIIVDAPAVHHGSVTGYADYWDSLTYRGEKLGRFIDRQALDGIERESTFMEFYDVVSKLKCPTAIFRGTHKDTKIASNLTDEHIQKYCQANPNVQIINFTNSGHMIFDDETEKAVTEIHRFFIENNI